MIQNINFAEWTPMVLFSEAAIMQMLAVVHAGPRVDSDICCFCKARIAVSAWKH